MIHFKIFLRSLWRNKLYSFISIAGLVASLTFVILLSAYLKEELSVDNFHANKEQIFQVKSELGPCHALKIGPDLKAQFPEFKDYCRFVPQTTEITTPKNRERIMMNMLFVDPAFFTMFDYHIEGKAFQANNEVIVSETFARKLFGSESAIGKNLVVGKGIEVLVTGIIEDFGTQTQLLPVDMLVHVEHVVDWLQAPELLTDYGNASFGLFLQTKPQTDTKTLEPKILEYFKTFYWVFQREHAKKLELITLRESYFNTTNNGFMFCRSSNQSSLYLISGIVILILIIALINYINLAMAQATFRAKESAVQQLVGSSARKQWWRKIFESEILCFFAFSLALLLSTALCPFFSNLLNTSIDLSRFWSPLVMTSGLLILLLLGLVAGWAPAAMFSRFKPIEVVKGTFRTRMKGAWSSWLIGFQYFVVIALIIGTLGIRQQSEFMKNFDMGFSKENIISLSSGGVKSSDFTALRNELMRVPGVKRVSFSSGSPIDGKENNSFKFNNQPKSFSAIVADTCFFPMFGIRLQPNGLSTTDLNACYLNKAGFQELGLDTTAMLATDGQVTFQILGQVADFHIGSLETGLGPLQVYRMTDAENVWARNTFVQIEGQDPAAIYRQVTKIYQDFFKGEPIYAEFCDAVVDAWYHETDQRSALIALFSALSILLAMMGMLAMASYYIQQRNREIAIRRIHGCSEKELLIKLCAHFLKMVGIAYLFAAPLSFGALNFWKQAQFAYQAPFSIWPYVWALLIVSISALLMVGGQCYRAATRNPVENIKAE